MKRVISYGAGTQSTALILMALEGEYNLPRPDYAVFADVGGEPQFVYDYLQYSKDLVKQRYDFDIHIIQHKAGLYNNLINGDLKVSKQTGDTYLSSTPPFY